MTTWERASDADIQTIRTLLMRLRRAGVTPPPFPPSAPGEDLSRLTQRDAGKYITQLREALGDPELLA